MREGKGMGTASFWGDQEAEDDENDHVDGKEDGVDGDDIDGVGDA